MQELYLKTAKQTALKASVLLRKTSVSSFHGFSPMSIRKHFKADQQFIKQHVMLG